MMALGTAVVTGAAGGVGAELCGLLRARAFDVVGVDVVAAPGVTEILDVRDADACRRLAARTTPRVWVNNAGVLCPGRAAGQPDDEIRRCLDVNLLGTINGSRAAAEVMVARGRGTILNVGSLASWIAVPGEAVYAATKHGVRAFTFGLRSELRGTGVRVSLLCPDGIWTPMLHDRLDDPDAAMSFTGKLLDPPAVAAAALALLDSGAALRSVPRHRGAQVRVLGSLPAAWIALLPALSRLGRLNQARLTRTANHTTKEGAR